MDEESKTVEITEAFILGDGSIMEASELKKFEIKKGADDGGSRQIEDPFSELYGKKDSYSDGDLIKPPYNLNVVAGHMENSTYHSKAVKQKAIDISGRGYSIVPAKGVENPSQKELDALNEFFDNLDEPILEILEQLENDIEGLGNGSIEMTRNKAGLPAGLYHIPFATMRISRDKKRFCQARGIKKVWFKAIGITEKVDKSNGKIVSKTDNSLDASEIIHIKNYSARNSYYGIPDHIPALGAIMGNLHARDYQLQFFENNAVPQYAIIVKGGSLSEPVKKLIAHYFKNEIKGDAHKTLIIPVPEKDIEVTFEKLAVELKDASFRLYKQDNRDEQLVAHGVPKDRLFVTENGSLGGSSSREASKIYKASTLTPRQRKLEHRINKHIIRDGFGFKDWRFKLDEIDTDDESQTNEIDAKNRGSLPLETINEQRRRRGLSDFGPDGDDIIIVTGTGVVIKVFETLAMQKIAAGIQSIETDPNTGAITKINKSADVSSDQIIAAKYLKVQNELAPGLEKVLKRYFKDQEGVVLGKVEQLSGDGLKKV